MPRWLHKTADEFIGIFLAVFLVVIAFSGARAAQITAASDVMTRLKAGTPANHAISFVTPSGAPEGSTITVTFPTTFNASGLNEGDVDLLDNGLPVSTATDCSGTEQAAAVWTGNTLSFQICPGDGGSFAPGSNVGILIGTNAIDSGVGVNRIVNPPTPGAYRLAIGGSFGDSGFAPMAIAADDALNVTACVGAACNVAPPPPPPSTTVVVRVGGATGPGQTPPPQISGLTIDQITSTTARVSWHTDVNSSSYVLFGPTVDYGGVDGNATPTQGHAVVLLGLDPGRLYHLAARSVGYFGDVGLTSDATFTTQPLDNGVLPQISDIRLVSIGGNDAEISWNTDAPTYWQIEFGRTVNYGNEINDAKYTTVHDAIIGDLTPNTAYHFQITAIDANGDQSISTDQVFTTYDSVPPKIFNAGVEYIAPHRADIIWQTNKPSTGGVKYGIGASYEAGEALEIQGFGTIHRISLSNLLLGTIYHYQIYQTDENQNDARSADAAFSTAALPQSPEPPTNIVVAPTLPPKNSEAIGSGRLPLVVNGVPTSTIGNVAVAAPGSVVGIALPPELVSKPIVNAGVQVGNKVFALKDTVDGSYKAYFGAPNEAGEQPVTVTVNYADKSSIYSRLSLQTVAAGKVMEIAGGKQLAVPLAKVTILANGQPWDGSLYGQNGEQLTDAQGGFSFYVPKGKYSLKIEKNGYITNITAPQTYDGPVSGSILIGRVARSQANFLNISQELAKYITIKPDYAVLGSIAILAMILAIIVYIWRNKLKRHHKGLKKA